MALLTWTRCHGAGLADIGPLKGHLVGDTLTRGVRVVPEKVGRVIIVKKGKAKSEKNCNKAYCIRMTATHFVYSP